MSSDYMRREYAALDAAWDVLFRDFRQRVEAGRMHLSGIQTDPERHEARSAIPGVWVADYEFDFRASTVVGAGRRYVSVRLSELPYETATMQTLSGAPPVPLSGPAVAAAPVEVTAETVRGLTDEALFLFLEEYASRVVEEEGSELKMPVKVSFMPILRRKMRSRAAAGEMKGTLKAEANELEAWIKTKIDGHQPPTASTIEKQLNDDYRALKRTSKPDIR
ncbi:hypothetical protein [Falsiroseomonas sp. HW251]|uniref:hypothetical protein n=1 Tax=Falsiroseomonas sp. HW251 TaxID=3390998 RepID=UPI003D323B41